jgi:hypothetical protein
VKGHRFVWRSHCFNNRLELLKSSIVQIVIGLSWVRYKKGFGFVVALEVMPKPTNEIQTERYRRREQKSGAIGKDCVRILSSK